MDKLIQTLGAINLNSSPILYNYKYQDLLFRFLLYPYQGIFRYQAYGPSAKLQQLHHWDNRSKTIKIPVFGLRSRLERQYPDFLETNEMTFTISYTDFAANLLQSGFILD